MDELRLYVWPECAPDYTHGLAFAIATSEDEAVEMITQRMGWDPEEWGPLEMHPVDSPIGFGESGGA